MLWVFTSLLKIKLDLLFLFDFFQISFSLKILSFDQWGKNKRLFIIQRLKSLRSCYVI